MKNLSRLLFATLLLLSFSNANAQDENNPWAITIGVNAVDFYPVGETAPLGDYFDEYFNLSDHYNFLPSLSSISVSKYLGDGFSFMAAGTINEIDKVGDSSADDLSYYGLDGTIKYSFANLINSKVVEPYLGVGGGYTWVDEIGAGTLNGTAGLTFWFSENIGITAQSSYKHAFEDYLAKHFQHTVGLAIKFGGKDTDGDGLYDNEDACPEVAGLPQFDGCPDSDCDGVEDRNDACVDVAGLAQFNGCPDTDGDGIADTQDACPTEAGVAALNGCPDADGDGITDADDSCPNEAGPSSNGGCPFYDADNDGVEDKDDKCPDVAGTVASKGCPEIKKEVVQKISLAAKGINFENGKAVITASSFKSLDDLATLLNTYPGASVEIQGHTDNNGTPEANKTLSQDRANAVKRYLSAGGVAEVRMTAVGYGQEMPIADNATPAGKAKNRRVDFKLSY